MIGSMTTDETAQAPQLRVSSAAGRWVLVDYVDVVIHLFHPTMRQFYQLERLWDDAAGVSLDAQGALA